MKTNNIQSRILVLCVLLFIPFAFYAKESANKENEKLLKQLDEVIAHKDQYRALRITTADSLKNIAFNSIGDRRTQTIRELYSTYERFRNDSALAVLNYAETIPEFSSDTDFRDFVHISLARTLAVMGIFSDAFDYLEKVDPSKCSDSNKLLYYNVQHAANVWMADFTSISAPQVAAQCQSLAMQYNDSIIELEPDIIYKGINKATKAYKNGDIEESINIAKQLIGKGESSHQIYVYAILAQAFGKFGNTDQELRYLTLTAINDISNGISEYMALPLIALRIFSLGQTDRAYNYIICAMDDATYSNAKLRTLEATEYFPIIDKGHQEAIQLRRAFSILAYFSLGLLVIALIGGIFSLRRQMHKLSITRIALARANSRLEESNTKLQIINKDLVTADRIKEEYITRYLNKCKKYLEALETYRNQLYKHAQAHQWDELFKIVKSDAAFASEKERFYADFDELFLNLYPNFIEQFNALLTPEAQIVPKKGELLTTELRIFALIKLGIDDSSQIAKFLSYSLTTIYNYRSRIRNNALDTNVDFETKVLEL